jgi:predicted AlkP superfamily phosphohydrolase/phosphomutase
VSQRLLDRYRVGYFTRVSAFRGAQAIAVVNSRIGAVRLNLVGREPDGRVRPGAEAESVLARIEEAAAELREERTGEPVLLAATRASEAFGADAHPDLPDLFLELRADLGRIRAVRSARLGRLHCPRLTYRTGDHTPNARLWIAGPGIDAVDRLRGADLLDVSATVLELCGVEPRSDLDGRALHPAGDGRAG